MAASQPTLIARKDQDARFKNLDATGNVIITGTLAVTGAQTFTGAPAFTGVVTASAGVKRPVQTITGDGAITIRDGMVLLTKGSAAAITLAAPTTGTHDGITIQIIAGSAQAHVVTTTGMAAGSGQDVLTFGGAINDSIVLVAISGGWYICGAPRNVTAA